VIATGARNRRPPVPGLDHPDVIELRSLEHAERIASRIGRWRRVAVIGGGFIGLEAAGLLSLMGIAVDVVEMAPRLMGRAVSLTVSAWFRDFHHANGVQLHMPQTVAAVEHRPERSGGGVVVTLGGGDLIEADAVLLAAGVVPNTELAGAAGLELDNGIVVDGLHTTSDPAISAIGDCATDRRWPPLRRTPLVLVDPGRSTPADRRLGKTGYGGDRSRRPRHRQVLGFSL
jgi:3-phenylpropionate/trans-cinnamate dioxygenase ferredoxin reductase subunit